MTDMWKVCINLKFALAGKIVSSGEKLSNLQTRREKNQQ